MTSLQDFIDRDALISENERLVKQLEQLQTKESRRLELRIAQEREDAQRRLQVRELKRLLSAEAIKQDMLSMIAQHAPLLTPPSLHVYEGSSARPEHTWVLVFSDLQYGQKTTLEASGMVFEQSSAVARAQFSLLRDKLELLLQLEYATKNVKELVVLDLGDNHEGDSLRVSQATKVDAPVTVQCIETTDLITEFVTWALTRFPKVRYLKVGGNHDRISQKPGTAGLGELSMIDTFAWLQGEFLRRLFGKSIEDGRLSLTNHESWFGAAHIAGQRFVYEHGASFRASTGCVDPSTEILTADGWKKHDQLIEGEMVATWDRKLKHLTWEPLQAINRYEHTGEMVYVEQQGLDMMLTPNHRVVVGDPVQEEGKRAYTAKVKEADALTGWETIPTASKWDAYGEYGSYRDGARLGWFLAEGYWRDRDHGNGSEDCYCGGGRKRLTQPLEEREPHVKDGHRQKERIGELGLCQSETVNPEYVAEIRDLFKSYPHSETVEADGMVRWRILNRDGGAEFFRRWAEKKEPNWAVLTEWSEEALRGLYDALLRGDGSSERPRLTQKDGPIADFFQALAVRLGHRATMTWSSGRPGMVNVGIRKDDAATLRPDSVHRIGYSGTVWCPTTPNGTWVARRNGTVFITGNSYGGVSYYSIANAAGGYMRMLDGADMVVFGHFHQPMVLPIKGGWGWQVVNGAFPPSTEFVQSNFKGFGRPCQLLLDFHDDYGMVGSRPIYLETENMIKPGEFWAKVKEREDAA